MIVTNLLDQLKRDEGCGLMPYCDPQGILTIGYGHNLEATKEPVPQNITFDKANEYLRDDVQKATDALTKACPWVEQLDEIRRAVLINMCFNMGIGKLLGFRQTLALVKAGDYAQAASAMLDSLWAKQVGKRAERLSKQMATGEWQ